MTRKLQCVCLLLILSIVYLPPNMRNRFSG